MGRKSREKRERRAARKKVDKGNLLRDIPPAFRHQALGGGKFEDEFQKHVVQTRSVLQRYRCLDAAVALSVSDLWPMNVASPVKHIFAWTVLLELDESSSDALSISTYSDFVTFITDLYAAWPDMPMLEDFSPEADWGHVKVRLGDDFVPMFYGSVIERTPDFVEAFRITYAGVSSAQADMDLVVAVQARIIDALPDVSAKPLSQPTNGHVEVPPENFWAACRSALLRVGEDVAELRSKAGKRFEAGFGSLKGGLTRGDFGDKVMQGLALPFLAVSEDGNWIPISVRSGPAVVIDHWSRRQIGSVGEQTHKALAKFVAERFPHTYTGPMTLIVGDRPISHLPVSCVIAANSGLYLVCACDHSSYERASQAAREVYSALRRGELAYFHLFDGRGLSLGKGEAHGPSADELRILIVVTQSSTAFGTILVPEQPTRLMPLADFVTIFDEMDELGELENFWKFVEDQNRALSPFSSGYADLFASFKDSHGVLVEGAERPTMIVLDTHWGTARRFKQLSLFWSQAPRWFPDGSVGWQLECGTTGVVDLKSRGYRAFGFSTEIGACTFQTLVPVGPHLQIADGKMLELFSQLLADTAYRSRDLLVDTTPLFQQTHVVLNCEVTHNGTIQPDSVPEPLDVFPKVVVAASQSSAHANKFRLMVDARAVQAGLNDAKDASFEIRCLLETLQCCHDACGMQMPGGLAEQLQSRAGERPRYHLRVVDRVVDVPDYVNPVLPSPTDYKLARKQLAIAMQELGLNPGRYELSDAKSKIDAGRDYLRRHIERWLVLLDRRQFIRECIEQHDALLIAERLKIQRVRQSLNHDVEYDRLAVTEEARKEFGSAARHYRYLLEKMLSSADEGTGAVTDDVLRQLVGLVDWYRVLTDASDILHNEVGVGGVDIDDSYIPEVFYSTDSNVSEAVFLREYAKLRLGIGINMEDAVEGASDELLLDETVQQAFRQDLGFELQHLLNALGLLSQAYRLDLGQDLSLSYAVTPERISQALVEHTEGLSLSEAAAIVEFLTLSGAGILRLSGRDVDEGEVPYWEHTKRVQRYTIRPLVMDGADLRWGAETASRAANIWLSSVRDGYLPADFAWPNVVPVIRFIKEGIEKRLEARTGEIFLRHTPYVMGNVDFFRRFRDEHFEDVGDFDVLAYWPDTDTMVIAECKYNQPAYTVKDSRRLRDRIFGMTENDKKGQFSRILRRRQFVAQHRKRMLELLAWPSPSCEESRYLEVYVCREVYYWMVHPPYDVPTAFVRVDALDAWVKKQLAVLAESVDSDKDDY